MVGRRGEGMVQRRGEGMRERRERVCMPALHT